MRILTLDGGGIRGWYTTRILSRLEASHPRFLASVNLFAGTSTGGILALGLAAGLTPASIEAFYLENATKIFNASLEHQIESLIDLREPKYGNEGLWRALSVIFGLRKMGNLTREVLVTAYDCVGRNSVDMTREQEDLLCVDAALRSSAAETYFPAYQGFVDGGTSANNPSMPASAWALSHGHALADIRLLSVGTGNKARPPLDCAEWGAIQWMENGLVHLFLDAPAQRNDQYCREILRANYCRVDGIVDCATDETRDLETKLIAPADALDLSAAEQFLTTNF